MSERKSLKQFYRLWFEFLKLGLTQTKFTKKEKEFYLDWEMFFHIRTLMNGGSPKVIYLEILKSKKVIPLMKILLI